MPQLEHRNARKKHLLWIAVVALTALLILAVFLLVRAAKRAKAATELNADASPALSAAQSDAKVLPAPVTPSPSPAPHTEGIVELTPLPTAAPKNRYTAVIDADPENSRAKLRVTLDYTNHTGGTLYDIVLNLWPKAIDSNCLSIQSVTQDGADIYYSLCQKGALYPQLRIGLSRDLKDGEKVAIGIEYTLELPKAETRFGSNELSMNLGNALPILAVYENGAWREDSYEGIGDSFYSEAAAYSVVIRCPLTYNVAASGECAEARMLEDTNSYEALYRADAARDFALSFVKNTFIETAQTQSGVRVLAFTKQRKKSEALANSAAAALDYYEKKLGAYPYTEFSAVATKLTGGMEYPGLIMVSYDDLDGNAKVLGELYIAHEVAHQWFYNLVGSDQLNAPWIDEALVEFLSFDYIRAVHGQEYRDQLWSSRFHDIEGYVIKTRMDAKLSEFTKAQSGDYVYGVYARGSALYEALYQKLGEERFYSVLKSICTDLRFSFLSGDELIAHFSKAAGEDLTPFFESYMTLQPPAAQSEASW